MKQLLITDTSVLLNLLATQCAEEILSKMQWQFLVCKNVLEEALILRNRETQEISHLDLSRLISNGLLTVVELEADSEYELLVDYSALMGRGGKGEAMCFALAESRSLPVAIDDERAIKRAKQRYPTIVTLSTLSILQEWQSVAGISDDKLRASLKLIRLWANYEPGRNHPAYKWWNDLLK